MSKKGNSRFDSLVFDLGKVVIDFDWKRPLRKLEGRTPFSTGELIARLKSTDAIGRFESGALSSQNFYREMAEYLKLNVDFEEFTSIWSDIFLDELILDAGFFEPLKNRYRLILLSNTNEMHTQYLRRQFPILRVFDQQVMSFEVGAMKPLEKIYQAAMEAARTTPERLFYVDDVPAYVEAATQLGWTSVAFSGKDHLIQHMHSLGIHTQ